MLKMCISIANVNGTRSLIVAWQWTSPGTHLRRSMQICITECNTKSLSEATKVVAKKDYASHSKCELMLKFVAVSTFIMSHGGNVSVAIG